MPADHSTGWRDEEELVDYDSGIQPSFSPAEEEISEPEDRLHTPVPGQDGSSSPEYDFGDVAADDAPMAGQKRRQNSPEDQQRRKAPKDHSAYPPGTAPVGSKPNPFDVSAYPPGTAPVGSKP